MLWVILCVISTVLETMVLGCFPSIQVIHHSHSLAGPHAWEESSESWAVKACDPQPDIPPSPGAELWGWCSLAVAVN